MAVRRLALEPAQVRGHVDGISFEHPEWNNVEYPFVGCREICGAGCARSITKPPGQRVAATQLQCFTKHVAFHARQPMGVAAELESGSTIPSSNVDSASQDAAATAAKSGANPALSRNCESPRGKPGRLTLR